MRNRYLYTPNFGSAKVPSVLYYDHDGKFCGVDNGVDFQDDDAFLRVKWWAAETRSIVNTMLTAFQVEIAHFPHGTVFYPEGSNMQASPEGKNHSRRLR